MKFYRAEKKIDGKRWRVFIEIDETKKKAFNSSEDKMVENIAWTKFVKFLQEKKIENTFSKRNIKIDYFGSLTDKQYQNVIAKGLNLFEVLEKENKNLSAWK